jgi:hypothetical protein
VYSAISAVRYFWNGIGFYDVSYEVSAGCQTDHRLLNWELGIDGVRCRVSGVRTKKHGARGKEHGEEVGCRPGAVGGLSGFLTGGCRHFTEHCKGHGHKKARGRAKPTMPATNRFLTQLGS